LTNPNQAWGLEGTKQESGGPRESQAGADTVERAPLQDQAPALAGGGLSRLFVGLMTISVTGMLASMSSALGP
jgi:hypothetical protein